MEKIKMTIIVDIESFPTHLNEMEEIHWLNTEALSEKGELTLHSREIGDVIGEVVSIENIEILK